MAITEEQHPAARVEVDTAKVWLRDGLDARGPELARRAIAAAGDPERAINDIVAKSHRALALRHRHADDLRYAVTLRNDWTHVADKLAAELLNLDHGIAVS